MAEELAAASELQETINELSERVEAQLSEISELHKKNTELYKEIGALQQEIAEKETLLTSLLNENSQLKANGETKDKAVSELKRSAEMMTAENSRLSSELNACALREQELAEHISQMENSRFWKLTKPLRAVSRLLK